jgi:histidinol-phosphatase (PHP family)
MVWFSYHGGHSGEFCKHAKDSLRDVVERAIALGFTTYGLSEHCPRYETEDLFPDEVALGTAGLAQAFTRYFKEARALAEEYQDRIELLVGFETEALPTKHWRTTMQQLRARFAPDFIIGSVHTVRGIPIDLNPERTQQVTAICGGWEAFCIEYFTSVTDLVRSLRPEVTGHLDLVRRYEGQHFNFSPAVWESIDLALLAVKETGTLLELNAAPIRRGFGPVYPSSPILERARAMDIPVTLSDDSHGVDSVGGGLDACVTAARHAGYSEIHYLTRDGLTRDAARTRRLAVRSISIDALRPPPPDAAAFQPVPTGTDTPHTA